MLLTYIVELVSKPAYAGLVAAMCLRLAYTPLCYSRNTRNTIWHISHSQPVIYRMANGIMKSRQFKQLSKCHFDWLIRFLNETYGVRNKIENVFMVNWSFWLRINAISILSSSFSYSTRHNASGLYSRLNVNFMILFWIITSLSVCVSKRFCIDSIFYVTFWFIYVRVSTITTV